MRDMLPPIFQILTGLGFAGLLVIGLLARAALKPLAGRLTAFAALLTTLGLFLMSRATDATSLGAGAELFIGAGAAFFGSIVLVAIAMVIASRARGNAA